LIICFNSITVSLLAEFIFSGGLVMQFFSKFLHEQSGATVVEFGVILAILSLAVASALGMDSAAIQATANNSLIPS
jgi:Flp pilus assembly pilin Flp